jgi:cell wall-associated NlpC family hydrolase
MDDPRLTPARGDIAAKHLEGKVAAERFVLGEICEVIESVAAVRERPTGDASLLTQAIMGERAMVYDRNGEGWAWGQLMRDGYVGWLPETALAEPSAAPTHKVTAIRSFAFPGPSIKMPPIETLVMEALLTITREDGVFGVTPEGWYLPLRHIGRLDQHEADFVAVAERFVSTPYLWGGKSSLGIDCSGLVQLSLNAAGIACPRDSDMQQNMIGHPLDASDWRALRRGDLMFWKGHVAIVRDGETIVHANAHHMATAIEKTADAIARIAATGSEIAAIKRIEGIIKLV